MADFSSCLFEWQTLTAGLIAVFIGALTFWQVRQQMKQTSDIHDRQRSAQLSVARAKLPLASSAIARHAKQYVAMFDRIEPAVASRAGEMEPLEILSLPREALEVLDELVACTRDESAQFAVSAIYAEQQVLSARFEDMHVNPRSHTLSLDYYFLQPIIMHAFAMNLLLYGRRETESVGKIGWKDIRSSAKSLVTKTGTRERLLALIDDKAARGVKLPFALNQIDE